MVFEAFLLYYFKLFFDVIPFDSSNSFSQIITLFYLQESIFYETFFTRQIVINLCKEYTVTYFRILLHTEASVLGQRYM